MKSHPVQMEVHRVRELLRPPPKLTGSQWADAHAWLPREGNAEPGKYHLDRIPYQRAMLDDAGDPTIMDCYWQIARQLGKTLCLIFIAEYHIHANPSEVLIVYPALDDARAFSRDKLTPTMNVTPALKGLIRPVRSRDSNNTTLAKKFPGGMIRMCGANSASSLRQRSMRVILLDEIDGYKANSEGDPVQQADGRAETFHDAVKIKASTPTVKHLSRIEAGFESSDKQFWFCPCPRCGHWQTLKWSQVRWTWPGPDGVPMSRPEDAVYVCEGCRAELTDGERINMIKTGEWRATAPFTGIRGRHLSGLYRILGKKRAFTSYLHEFVAGFLKAKAAGKFGLMVWVNNFLGETWEDESEKVEASALAKRREDYGVRLPDGVLVITAGVDVQHDRLCVEVVGWGTEDESWTLLYVEIPGDVLTPKVWGELDQLLTREWKCSGGRVVGVTAACVDCADGSTVDAVHAYCRPRFVRRVFAVRGSNTRGDPLISGPTRSNRRRCPVYRIGTDTAKGIVYGRLAISKQGPGYMHFAGADEGCTERYFQMLTAEIVVTELRKGFPIRIWKLPPGRRNEALDCRVYATAALAILNPDWESLTRRVEKEAKPQTVAPDGQATVAQANDKALPPMARPPRKPRAGWLNGWRKF